MNRYVSNDVSLEYKQTFSTYSGHDMIATINIPGQAPIVFGELANISYSVFREKVPVRALGRVSMKGYTRGMRTITGILSFVDFNETVVYRAMEEVAKQGYKIMMDELPQFDVTISMQNEFGYRSSLTLYGISTYSEGKVMGIDTVISGTAYEFYALDISPLTKVNPNVHR